MAFKIADRVGETTTTTGTGTINLAGAKTGFRSFVDAIGNGNTCVYEINDGAGNWEVGVGTVTDGAPDTLSRDTVISNSLGTTAKINFGAGTKDVFVTVPGAHLPQSPTELTISSGAVTLSQEFHTVDTEADAASDVLDTIAFGPISEGQRVALMAANSARLVYLQASSTIGLPCLLSSDWPTEFRRIGGKLWPLDSMVLLDRQTASNSASLDFTKGIGSAFTHYLLVLNNVLPATDGTSLYLRVTEDGSTWQADAADYAYSRATQAGVTAGIAAGDNSAGAAQIVLQGVLGNVDGGVSGEIRFANPSGSVPHQFWGELIGRNSSGEFTKNYVAAEYIGATNAITGVRLIMASGNIASGTAALYGLRK